MKVRIGLAVAVLVASLGCGGVPTSSPPAVIPVQAPEVPPPAVEPVAEAPALPPPSEEVGVRHARR